EEAVSELRWGRQARDRARGPDPGGDVRSREQILEQVVGAHEVLDATVEPRQVLPGADRPPRRRAERPAPAPPRRRRSSARPSPHKSPPPPQQHPHRREHKKSAHRSIHGEVHSAAVCGGVGRRAGARRGGEHVRHGKVRMAASEMCSGEEGKAKAAAAATVKSMRHGVGEVGGFVLWQKRPEMWCLELVVPGCKISAGSDGKVAWRQTPWHHSHASRGPPRPLRRFLQGLDPRSTSDLFSDSVCIGEKAINDEDCFVLKLEAEHSTLRARSSSNVEIIRHTLWGYFSQRTGLLVQLEDTHLLRIKSSGSESVCWETTMESLIQDYQTIDGINIAHSGRTSVSLFRFGLSSESHSRTRMEEVWAIEEVGFNIKGLSTDCFLPPADLKKEEDACGVMPTYARVPLSVRSSSTKMSASKVVALDIDDDSYNAEGDEEL
ncbi:uncharacterized protein J3R85_013133, partial [Psidium guajava]